VSRVLPKGKASPPGATRRALWPFAPSSILLVSSRPATKGIILHLRETAGRATPLQLAAPGKGWTMEEVDALGGSPRPLTSLTFQPYETKFIRIRH
jgi:hypothetical protein